jgi:hypothetical protein
MAERMSHNRAKEREAGKSYLTNRIISISNIAGDSLSWNEPYNKDGYELKVTSGGKWEIYEIEAMDLIDTQRREEPDRLAELIVREFS